MTISLFCSEYKLDVQDIEVATLEILNRDCFRRIINELKDWNLSSIRELNILDGDSLININEMTVIFDPYSIDINDKNYLQKLYKAIESFILKSEENIFSLNELSAYINLHFNNLISGYPLDLSVKTEFTLKDFIKFLDLKVAEDIQSLQDRIIQFINANGIIKFTKIIVFVNLKSILTQEELENIISTAIRCHCPLLMIENSTDNRNFDNERKLLLDQDLYVVLK